MPTEFGNRETEREIAKLRKRSPIKSPVKKNVLIFEGKTKDELGSPENRSSSRRNQSLSPTRSRSPGINNERPNTLFSPTRSKSPGINNERPNNLFSPTRSKSPSVNQRPNQLISPNRSQSPRITSERVSQSFSPSPSKSPGNNSRSRWMFKDASWKKQDPEVTETEGTDLTEGRISESLPKVGDAVDVSWIFDNIDQVTRPEREETSENAPSQRKDSERKTDGRTAVRDQERFRNFLNYNWAEWEKDETPEEEKPKKADDFIQRLCDQVRNQVEYLCGMNFAAYKAVSYKVQIAGTQGIFYYVKVKVWQNYCLHLRIFSHKNELKAIPALQAILERTQPDNGNIDFF